MGIKQEWKEMQRELKENRQKDKEKLQQKREEYKEEYEAAKELSKRQIDKEKNKSDQEKFYKTANTMMKGVALWFILPFLAVVATILVFAGSILFDWIF